MFKSFQNLNSAIKQTKKSSQAFNLERILSAGRNILDITKAIPARYARMYSQVQWMRYDDQGSPSDVTPSEQDSAALEVIHEVQSDISSELGSYEQVGTVHVSKPVGIVPAYAINCFLGTRRYVCYPMVANGILKLNVISTGSQEILQGLRLYWGNPGTGITIRQESDGGELRGVLSAAPGRIILGVSYATNGKPVIWSSWPQSGSPNVMVVCCAYSGSVFKFTLTDRNYDRELVDYDANPMQIGSDDFFITNQTGLDYLVIYLQWAGRRAGIFSGDKFLLSAGTILADKWDTLVTDVPDLSTTVETDIGIDINDLYPGISGIISEVQNLA